MLQKVLLLFLCAAMAFAAPSFAQESGTNVPPPADDAAEKEDPFKVPEGTDSEALLLFLQRLGQTEPKERTVDGIVEHFKKIDQAVAEVLSRDIETDLYMSAAAFRVQVLDVWSQFNDEAATKKMEEFVKSLKADKRAEVQQIGARIELRQKITSLANASEEEQQKLVNDITTMIKDAGQDDEEALMLATSAAMQTAQVLERANPKQAVAALNSFASALKARGNEDLKEVIETLEGTARRLNLLGNKIQISGTTVKGEQFNINQYNGKVVLVDFWATWCGPCIAELPHVKEMYDAYHDKGFEVVGISLDSERERLETFLDERKIPWVTLFDDGSASGWDNSIAGYYGINAIPTVFLVDREGKVVNLNARGETLTEELAKLLGPIEKKPAEAEGTATETN